MIQLSGQRLEQVDSFKYLGATIRQDGSIDQEIGDRIAATGRLYHGINRGFIGKREVSKPTKMVVFKTIYTPTLTHSSESWALSSKHRSRLQAVEMRYLRKVEGKTRRDRVRNQTIRSSLDVQPLQTKIEEAQLRWFGHVVRMPDSRYPRRAWEARYSGRRSRGRPRIKWEDNVQRALGERGVSWRHARSKANNKKEWRALCKTSTPQGTRGPTK
ncbi:hypothetical protein GE061_010367 [Apolygus lucorum]|uniref:Endonuclease-reverse transcriptase n=1 Tax=Apolygus lucorum TaxID=248454 RepID=A0A8S9Y4V5_APOLU|nr:hypothetical protein GE061_010367 [Apolygus lucorum]